MKIFKATAWLQGIYYLLTGLWPIFHISSFIWVTGPKTDIWLVKTVGAFVVVIAIVLLVAAYRGTRITEIILLGAGSCIAFTLVDVIYVSKGTIPPVYLLDAVAETILLIGWVIIWIKMPPKPLPQKGID